MLQRTQADLVFPCKRPRERLLAYNLKVKFQIKKHRSFLISSEPGETFPIPTIMNVEPDTSDGPYETCEERLYTIMATKLSRTEAKELRKKVRDSGWDPFDGPPWEPIAWPHGPTIGWQFRRIDMVPRKCLTTICGGTRIGVRNLLLKEGRAAPHERRFVTIVQRDGGEIHVNGLLGKFNRSNTAAAVEVFDKFEV